MDDMWIVAITTLDSDPCQGFGSDPNRLQPVATEILAKAVIRINVSPEDELRYLEAL